MAISNEAGCNNCWSDRAVCLAAECTRCCACHRELIAPPQPSRHELHQLLDRAHEEIAKGQEQNTRLLAQTETAQERRAEAVEELRAHREFRDEAEAVLRESFRKLKADHETRGNHIDRLEETLQATEETLKKVVGQREHARSEVQALAVSYEARGVTIDQKDEELRGVHQAATILKGALNEAQADLEGAARELERCSGGAIIKRLRRIIETACWWHGPFPDVAEVMKYKAGLAYYNVQARNGPTEEEARRNAREAVEAFEEGQEALS